MATFARIHHQLLPNALERVKFHPYLQLCKDINYPCITFWLLGLFISSTAFLPDTFCMYVFAIVLLPSYFFLYERESCIFLQTPTPLFFLSLNVSFLKVCYNFGIGRVVQLWRCVPLACASPYLMSSFIACCGLVYITYNPHNVFQHQVFQRTTETTGVVCAITSSPSSR